MIGGVWCIAVWAVGAQGKCTVITVAVGFVQELHNAWRSCLFKLFCIVTTAPCGSGAMLCIIRKNRRQPQALPEGHK